VALTESTKIDQIEVVNDWNIQVRQATVIEKDGVQVARSFHRWVLTPDMDVTGQEEKVRAICNAAWTKEVRSAYEKFRAESEAKRGAK